jgi:hypothetical protein
MATFSRGRKQKLKVGQSLKTKIPKNTQERFPIRVLRLVATHWIAALISLVAAFFAIGASIWQIFVGPDLDISEAGAILPFAAPIKVTNQSAIFSLRDANVRCGVEKVVWSGGGGISGISFVFSQPKITIAPGESGNYQCRIANVRSDTLESADIFVQLEYYTLLWHRVSAATEFNWFPGASPPRWVKGAFPSQMKD